MQRESGWKSPLKTTDRPELNDPKIVPVDQLVLFTDANDWGGGVVIAPHTSNGAAKRNGSGFIYPSQGQTSKKMGAVGGNIELLDGSVSWKKIDVMKQTYWTAEDNWTLLGAG